MKIRRAELYRLINCARICSGIILILCFFFCQIMVKGSDSDSLLLFKKNWNVTSITKKELSFSATGVSSLPLLELEIILRDYVIVLKNDTIRSDSIRIDSVRNSGLVIIFFYDQHGSKVTNYLKIRSVFNDSSNAQTYRVNFGIECEKQIRPILDKYKSELIIPVLVSTHPSLTRIDQMLKFCKSRAHWFGLIEVVQSKTEKGNKTASRNNMLFSLLCQESIIDSQIKENLNFRLFKFYEFTGHIDFKLTKIDTNENLNNLGSKLIHIAKPAVLEAKIDNKKMKEGGKSQSIKSKENHSNNQVKEISKLGTVGDSLRSDTNKHVRQTSDSLLQKQLSKKYKEDSLIRIADSLKHSGYVWKYCDIMIRMNLGKPGKKNNSDLKRLIDSLLFKSFESKKYDSLYRFIKSSKNLACIQETFLNKLSLAECYERFGETGSAYESYKWLIFNWRENNIYISRKEGMSRFQKYQFLTLRFDDCIELNERIYDDFNDESAIPRVISSMRAKYAFPVLNILSYYLRYSVNKGQLMSMFPSISSSIPSFYECVYLIKNDKGAPELLYSKTAPAILKDIKGNSVMCRIDKERVFLLLPVEKSGMLVIQMNTNLTASESRIFGSIKQKQGSSRFWNQIESEEKEVYRLITVLFSKTMETPFTEGKNALSNYWPELKKGTSFISYIVRYDNSGKLIDSKSFIRSKAVFQENQYEKSSKTMGYYQQEIEYDGRSVIDIANPIYQNSKYSGSIRIGFLK